MRRKRHSLLVGLALAVSVSAGAQVDHSSLATAVGSAEEFLSSIDQSKYPKGAIADYRDAIDIVRHVVNGQTCETQTQVITYRNMLNTAKTRLQAAKGKKFDISDIRAGYDPEGRGFVHPGGLHTQADFDRIKRQLAAKEPTVTAAHKVLTSAAYAQPSAATYPTASIIRGGTGDNYMNAAKGAAIAYQNALRWKIDGNTKCADHAVDVLMAWCDGCKAIEGGSDARLATGIYGYEFAQAAELMRDYEGWSREDFRRFQRWMLDLWYPNAINFLRARNGTWENAGTWWQAPGHYWSNWGLCNVLCCMSIGVLCDDVFIYNQGMSFFKYDQVGTFKDPRVSVPILADGLTDFLGNLVVTTTEWEGYDGAYGKVGQMNESGRDTGHAAMALGLAVDIAHMGWNQGDDLFAHMDHRLAAGIEYVAAQSQNVQNLPWTNYHYYTSGFYITDSRSWLMTEPALGVQIRPIWGTVIGIYEGVKGVRMPYSEMAYKDMGIDNGGLGSTSGGYDHLGYSVLMNTRDGIAGKDEIPTELTGQIEYGGKTYKQTDAGGLKNTYSLTPVNERGVSPGTEVRLHPMLPEGVTDTGKWQWETGETSRDITVSADRSRLFRVTYTNEHGVESHLAFSIAVKGDARDARVITSIEYDGKTMDGTDITVMYGSKVKLSVHERGDWNDYAWDNGSTEREITIQQIANDRDVDCYVITQSGRKQLVTFHIKVMKIRPDIVVNGTTIENTPSYIARKDDDIVLSPSVGEPLGYGSWKWDDGSADGTLSLGRVVSSQLVTATYSLDGQDIPVRYEILVPEQSNRVVENGNYRIRHRGSGLLLTRVGDAAGFRQEDKTLAQVWNIQHPENSYRSEIISLTDSMVMKKDGAFYSLKLRPFRFLYAEGTDYVAIFNSSNRYWYLTPDGTFVPDEKTALDGFDFELLPFSDEEMTGIATVADSRKGGERYFRLNGESVANPGNGIFIVRYPNGMTKKILRR
ncbi:MAG: alginate lyase family protein [Bacteroidaceae bacterium]|nr:alginate lyase family protein [Bacteroidaceae bacterium]